MIWAIIRTQTEGFHYWKKAPEKVGFLRNLHRHIFFVEVWIEQGHQERDIEYIQEKKKVNEFLERYKQEQMIGNFSCENLASDLKLWIERYYSSRKVKVFVFEDNENGCLVE